jgi:hypothetical protein
MATRRVAMGDPAGRAAVGADGVTRSLWPPKGLILNEYSGEIH